MKKYLIYLLLIIITLFELGIIVLKDKQISRINRDLRLLTDKSISDQIFLIETLNTPDKLIPLIPDDNLIEGINLILPKEYCYSCIFNTFALINDSKISKSNFRIIGPSSIKELKNDWRAENYNENNLIIVKTKVLEPLIVLKHGNNKLVMKYSPSNYENIRKIILDFYKV